MRDSKRHAETQESKIQCIEVLISKKAIAENGHNLLWTLSVYSLENHPVTKNSSINSSDIFNFMVYDWKRTIKQLLINHRIPYSIVQYFTPNSIYSHSDSKKFGPSEDSVQQFSPLNFTPEAGENVLFEDNRNLTENKQHKNTDLILAARGV